MLCNLILHLTEKRQRNIEIVVRRTQEIYRDQENKLHICFIDIQKAFARVPRKVRVSDEEESFVESNCKSDDELYQEVKTKVKVRSGLSEEFWVHVGIHQGSSDVAGFRKFS